MRPSVGIFASSEDAHLRAADLFLPPIFFFAALFLRAGAFFFAFDAPAFFLPPAFRFTAIIPPWVLLEPHSLPRRVHHHPTTTSNNDILLPPRCKSQLRRMTFYNLGPV